MLTQTTSTISPDSPIIKCDVAKAYIGDNHVNLRCEVRAKPSASALFWILDRNGTTVTEGEVIDEYWTLVKVTI